MESFWGPSLLRADVLPRMSFTQTGRLGLQEAQERELGGPGDGAVGLPTKLMRSVCPRDAIGGRGGGTQALGPPGPTIGVQWPERNGVDRALPQQAGMCWAVEKHP